MGSLAHTRKPAKRRAPQAGQPSARPAPRSAGAPGQRFQTIAAKYAGTCRRCGGEITPGMPVRWAPKRGTYHLADQCGLSLEEQDAATADLGPVPSDDALDVIYRQRWAIEDAEVF